MKLYTYYRSQASFRVRIALNLKGLAREDVHLHLERGHQFAPEYRALNPQMVVPTLLDGETKLFQSLAILEYLAENFPAAALWPTDAAARAHARAIAAEMHAGFVPLRRHCPMNFWRPVKRRDLTAEVAANVARIDAMWSECRARFGAGGPFLFGRFSAADAMYAPVVSRFQTYDVQVGPVSRGYMDAVMALPAWAEWRHAAVKEPWVLAEDEPDWPTVLRA